MNINGGAFFSQPLSYVRAKERYWSEMAINNSYGNVCPCNKPHMQNETGLSQLSDYPYSDWNEPMRNQYWTYGDSGHLKQGAATPTRCGIGSNYYMPCASGVAGSWNNCVVTPYSPIRNGDVEVDITWREPIFASPFSSRIDATYGRPLYNITSMDIAFNMQSLGNMIRCVDTSVDSYDINLESVMLCYQVMTVPIDMAPSYTVVPYRRFVPYITDYPSNPLPTNQFNRNIEMTSGVYTLNEIPTAIWVFAGPTKRHLQLNEVDGFEESGGTHFTTYGNNKLFGFLRHISISLANTTQILNTAEPLDLYRIAKANGCQDSFNDWGRVQPLIPKTFQLTDGSGQLANPLPFCGGPGSVLRLIPGTDLIIPEQDLVPGANANNMVFQVTANFDFPPSFPNCADIALWVLFEYVGVATITPGQCEITMNPLGDGRVMSRAPIVSTTASEAPSTTEGSGWLDTFKNILSKVNQVAKKTGIIGNLLNFIPAVGPTLSAAAKSIGYGETRKRARPADYDGAAVMGGAVMGMGDFI